MLEIFILKWFYSELKAKQRSLGWLLLALLLAWVGAGLTSLLGEHGYLLGYFGGYIISAVIISSLDSMQLVDEDAGLETTPRLPPGPTMKQELAQLTVPVARAEGIDLAT